MSIFTENLMQGLSTGMSGYSPYDLHAALLGEGQNALNTKRYKDALALEERKMDFDEDKRTFLEAMGFYREGAGTPEERAKIREPYGLSTEPSYQVPGSGNYLYGDQAPAAEMAGPKAPYRQRVSELMSLASTLAPMRAREGRHTGTIMGKQYTGPASRAYQNIVQRILQESRRL